MKKLLFLFLLSFDLYALNKSDIENIEAKIKPSTNLIANTVSPVSQLQNIQFQKIPQEFDIVKYLKNHIDILIERENIPTHLKLLSLLKDSLKNNDLKEFSNALDLVKKMLE